MDRVLEGTRPEQAAPTVPPPPGEEPSTVPRLILLAVDGVDPELAERGMMEEWLPNLRRLRLAGAYGPIAGAPGTPAEGAAEFLSGGPPRGGDPVRRVAAAELFPRGVPAAYPSDLPALAPTLARPAFVTELAARGIDCVLLRPPAGFPDAGGERVAVLGGASLPDASFSRGRYLFAVEDAARAGERSARAGGDVAFVAPTNPSAANDVFVLDIAGPSLGGTPAVKDAAARVEVRASKDRARITIATEDDVVAVAAGEWSRPLRLRFAAAAGLNVYGRASFYVRPTGKSRLELYVEAPGLDPAAAPAWLPVSEPRELALELERATGGLPRLNGAFPAAALADGVLDARDAARAIEAQFRAERRLFEAALARGKFQLLAAWFSAVDDAVRLGPGSGDEADQLVDLFDRRVPRRELPAAALAAVDEVIGSALRAADSGDFGIHAQVLVVAAPSARTGAATGVFALNRSLGAEARPRLVDLAATAADLLGAGSLPSLAGARALPRGAPMERLTAATLEVERRE